MQNRKKYSENWADEVRPSILKRDKYKCVHCGMPHRSWVVRMSFGKYLIIPSDEIADYIANGKKPYKVFLQVAHLDNNTLNNDPSNLRTLCPACHNLYDARYKALLRIAKLATGKDV